MSPWCRQNKKQLRGVRQCRDPRRTLDAAAGAPGITLCHQGIAELFNVFVFQMPINVNVFCVVAVLNHTW